MRKSRLLAINAMLATLTLLFTFIPMYIGPLTLAVLMLLPTIIASQLEDWRTALFCGLFLGLTSFIKALAMPVTPVDFMLRNPMISVLPRIIIGMVGFGVHKGLHKLFKDKGNTKIGFTAISIISGCAVVITNTTLVLSMIWAFNHGKTFGETVISPAFITSLISLNFVLEVTICPLLTPAIVYAISKATRKSKALMLTQANSENANSTETQNNNSDDDTTKL